MRLSKEEWQDLDIISRWLIATRAAVLIMTFLSAAFAGILAYRDGHFVWWRWVLLAIGLIFAHATNNIINDITDQKKGWIRKLLPHPVRVTTHGNGFVDRKTNVDLCRL